MVEFLGPLPEDRVIVQLTVTAHVNHVDPVCGADVPLGRGCLRLPELAIVRPVLLLRGHPRLLRNVVVGGNGLHFLLGAVPHVQDVAEDDSLVDLQVRVQVLDCEFPVVRSKLSAVALLRVYLIKLLREGTGMHHTLVLEAVLRVRCHVDHNWVVLRQRCLEVGFLPFELLEFVRSQVGLVDRLAQRSAFRVRGVLALRGRDLFSDGGIVRLACLIDGRRSGARPIHGFGLGRALAAQVVRGPFFLLLLVDRHLVRLLYTLNILLLAVFPREPKILEMHPFDIVELAVLRLAVNGVRVLALTDLELLEYLGVRVVVPAEEAVLLASEPPTPERKVHDAAGGGVDGQVDVVGPLHVLGQKD